MSKRMSYALLCGCVVLSGLFVVVALRHRAQGADEAEEQLAEAGPPPAGARETARQLADSDPETQRDALAPELSEIVEAAGGPDADTETPEGEATDTTETSDSTETTDTTDTTEETDSTETSTTEGSEERRGVELRLDDKGWRSTIDGFGNSTGTLRLPDGESIRVEIGFVEANDAWRVTYIEALQ